MGAQLLKVFTATELGSTCTGLMHPVSMDNRYSGTVGGYPIPCGNLEQHAPPASLHRSSCMLMLQVCSSKLCALLLPWQVPRHDQTLLNA